MADPFFLPAAGTKKKLKRRGEEDDGPTSTVPALKRARKAKDSVMEGSDAEIDPTARIDGAQAPVSMEETADEKRLRLAQDYLGKVREEAGSDADEEEIHDRLMKSAADEAGRGRLWLAEKLKPILPSSFTYAPRAHKLSVTCIALSEDGTRAFTGSKDGTVCKWDVEAGKCVATYQASDRFNPKGQKHKAHVLAVAVSSDGRFLASGGEDRAVHVWDVAADKRLEQMAGHRDTVTALAFRQDSHQLFSGSLDRTVKVWNADSLSYVETLFGHQSGVMAVDTLLRERAVSCGLDNTLRVWKIVEETQLVFRGHTASIDCANLINESLFLAGSQDGALSVWSPAKKKPVCVRQNAHGGAWISSLSSCRRSDLAASGSSDGCVRLWHVRYGQGLRPGDNLAGVGEVPQNIPLVGFVNGLAFSKNGRLLVAGVGQEHRLGRWQRIGDARNGVVLIPLEYDE